MTRLLLLILLGMLLPDPGLVQSPERYEGPIIDMHLHAYTAQSYWGQATAEEHRTATLEVMNENGVVLGVVSGDELAAAESLATRAPNRFLKGITVYDPRTDLDIEEFVDWIRNGRLDIFAEVAGQYAGYSPSDPVFDSYWSVAEEHGIPVGIHTGEAAPGTPYRRYPRFRVKLGDPLLLEDMLVAHPDLKVFVEHAGGWFYERTLQLMQMYPHVYAEVGVLGHAREHVTTKTLERFLKRAKAFGYLDRVMFGSDQMVWPEMIKTSIEAVQAIDFLTIEEKQAIFYDNAAQFLELSEQEIARHHGK